MSVHLFKTSTGKHGIRIYSNGRQTQKVVGSLAAATRLKKKVEYDLAARSFGILDQDKPTFKAIASEYLLFLQQLNRASSTINRYDGLLRNHINKVIGDKQVDQISRGDIKSLLSKFYSGGASRSAVDLMQTVCSGVFQYAYDRELIDKIPSMLIMKQLGLTKTQKEINPFSPQEIDVLLKCVRPKYYVLFVLLLQTGMRIGEALALSWDDVNFLTEEITVRKTAKDQLIKSITKTRVNRKVEITAHLVAVLTTHKKMDRKGNISLVVKPKTIFHDSGRLLSDNTIRRELKRACRKAGVAVRTPHDCRHTYASMHIMNGTPIQYVSKMLGHSSSKITWDRYVHYVPQENNNYKENLRKGNKEKNRSGMSQV